MEARLGLLQHPRFVVGVYNNSSPQLDLGQATAYTAYVMRLAPCQKSQIAETPYRNQGIIVA